MGDTIVTSRRGRRGINGADKVDRGSRCAGLWVMVRRVVGNEGGRGINESINYGGKWRGR
jgi:hypothetical protein